MERNIALAQAAGELVGTPFRLQGRDCAHGLDCIGLVLVSLARIGVELRLPADYRPRRRRFAIPVDALCDVDHSRPCRPRPGGRRTAGHSVAHYFGMAIHA